MFGLVMFEEYLYDILKGYRKCDVRMHPTNKRGRIALIKSKTKMIYGYVDFISIDQITYEDYIYWHVGENYTIEDAEWDIESNLKYSPKPIKRTYAYNFKNPILLDNPIELPEFKKTGSWIEFDERKVNKPYIQLKDKKKVKNK